MLSESLANNDT